MDLVKNYNSLPEWLRWLLFLPISTFLAHLVYLIFNNIYIYGAIAYPEYVIYLLAPILFQAPFLYLVYYTIPRWKIGAMISFIALRIIYVFLMIILLAQGIPIFKAPVNIPFEVIREAVAFVLSIAIVATIKKWNRE